MRLTGIEVKKENKLVALTMSLKSIIDRDIDKARSPAEAENYLNSIESGIEHYKKSFEKPSDNLTKAFALHTFIDDSLEDNRKKHPKLWSDVKCKAGCGACCHNPVIANVEEAELLLEYVDEQELVISWDLVREQAKFQGSEHEYFLLPKHENRCAFLDRLNQCTVYKHRPAACRKYFVTSKPEKCDERVGSQDVAVIADTQVELAASAFMDMDHNNVGFLPQMLMRAKSNRRAHCNHCSEITETKEWDCLKCGLSKGHP